MRFMWLGIIGGVCKVGLADYKNVIDTFLDYDEKEDGVIDKVEFKSGLSAQLSSRFPNQSQNNLDIDKIVDSFYQIYDKDNDGKLGLTDFKKLMNDQQEQIKKVEEQKKNHLKQNY